MRRSIFIQVFINFDYLIPDREITIFREIISCHTGGINLLKSKSIHKTTDILSPFRKPLSQKRNGVVWLRVTRYKLQVWPCLNKVAIGP